MHKCLRVTLVVLAAASLSCARADDLQNLMRALGTAIQGQMQQQGSKASSAPGAPADGIPPTTAGFNRVGRNVDTPENLELLKSRVRTRIERADLASTNVLVLMQQCKEEMKPLSAFEVVIGTGYDELRAKCEVEAREPIREFEERQAANARQQRDAAAAAAERQKAEKGAEEERQRARAIAELRSGQRQPVNCQQWVAAKGEDPRSLNAPVTQVAYRAPKGVGFFSGRIEQINADTMLLSDQPIFRIHGTEQGYMVVTVARAKVFNGSEIKVGTVVEGFASQTGSRMMRMTDGSGKQAPVLLATCMHALF